jgi:hypothetical protein
MTVGNEVIVKASTGNVRLILAEDRGDVLLLCGSDEWQAAKREARVPISIGFRRSDLVLDTAERLKHNIQYEPAEHGQTSADRLDASGGVQPARRHAGR